MTARRLLALALCALLLVGAGCLGALDDGSTPEPDADASGPDDGNVTHPIEPPPDVDAGDYPARVELYDGEQRVATIYAETATNSTERYTGLSDHESLEPWEGMLFVFPFERPSLTFVMRDMSFGIDIVYVGEQGCVRELHAAEQPAPGESGEEDHHRYPGSGQYVVEVPIGVATEGGVEPGDPVVLEYGDTVVDGTDACGFASE